MANDDGLAGHGEERGFAAIREGVALAPLADRGLLEVRGEDRVGFLQGMLSNEISGLGVGEVCRALLLTEQGRVVSDLRVWCHQDCFWLEAPAAARSDVREALERFIVADDVEIADLACVGVRLLGPAAAGVLDRVLGSLEALASTGTHRRVLIDDHEVGVAHDADLGVDAFSLWTSPNEEEEVRRALLGAGAEEVGAAAIEIQRVAAGIGRLGLEFGLDTIAPEDPSLEPAISYEKGCYLGQEVIERVASRGRVQWKIARLCGGVLFLPGDVVTAEGAEVGRVTSVAQRPDDGTVWALARIRAVQAEAGTELKVSSASGHCGVKVVEPVQR